MVLYRIRACQEVSCFLQNTCIRSRCFQRFSHVRRSILRKSKFCATYWVAILVYFYDFSIVWFNSDWRIVQVKCFIISATQSYRIRITQLSLISITCKIFAQTISRYYRTYIIFAIKFQFLFFQSIDPIFLEKIMVHDILIVNLQIPI